MEEPVYLNPLDLYIVREFAADGADYKAIAETHCGLFYEEDEINISNAIAALMYRVCNGKDKSTGISKEQFEHLETRHPMLEVSRNHTILITTVGISEYKDGECRELEWSKIDSARYDEENSRYEFICNDELFDKSIIIGEYDMIKWSEATPLVTSVLCYVIEIIAEHI